jgi:hypothetical protein
MFVDPKIGLRSQSCLSYWDTSSCNPGHRLSFRSFDVWPVFPATLHELDYLSAEADHDDLAPVERVSI